jgi:hypothetical protein
MPSKLATHHIKLKVYRTIILTVLYGCETWCFILRKEHGPSAFVKRALRKIFGHKRSEVVGDWRRSRNEEVHGLCSSPDIIRVIK